MTGNFSFYDADGNITFVVKALKADLALNPQWGTDYIEAELDPSEQYIKNGKVVGKTSFNPVVSGNRITGLPVPCKATIDGITYEITDGVLDLDANVPGPFTVLIKSAPYFDKEVIIP